MRFKMSYGISQFTAVCNCQKSCGISVGLGETIFKIVKEIDNKIRSVFFSIKNIFNTSFAQCTEEKEDEKLTANDCKYSPTTYNANEMYKLTFHVNNMHKLTMLITYI